MVAAGDEGGVVVVRQRREGGERGRPNLGFIFLTKPELSQLCDFLVRQDLGLIIYL